MSKTLKLYYDKTEGINYFRLMDNKLSWIVRRGLIWLFPLFVLALILVILRGE